MDESAPLWLSCMEPAPPGFVAVALRKRHLLNGPIALLLPDLSVLHALMPDYPQRFQGVLITPGDAVHMTVLSPYAWHATLPLPLGDTERKLITGWLHSIAQADSAQQRCITAETRNERLARELESTRVDYLSVTERLQSQVGDLLQAKRALSDSNFELERRVAQRTAALADANTHLSHAMRELQQAQSELVHQEKMAGLGSMVAGVAHELNTPIGNALTVATTLCYESRQLNRAVQAGALTRSALERYTAESEEMSDVVERNLRMAAEIIGHFKQLAVDQTSERRREFYLSDVVSDTLSALSPRLRKTSHRLELRLAEKVRLDSYPGAISQVLANLVDNALVHAFDGREQGTMLLVSHLSEDQKSVEIVFSDDGVGIPEANQKKVFDPFFTTRLGQGGSGLGMHLVYNLVTLMLGGKISLHSALHAGTQVRLTIPLQAAPSPS